MSIYDLARDPCHAFSPAGNVLPTPDWLGPGFVVVPPVCNCVPDPPTPAASPVPLAPMISDHVANALAQGGKVFFRHMTAPVLRHG